MIVNCCEINRVYLRRLFVLILPEGLYLIRLQEYLFICLFVLVTKGLPGRDWVRNSHKICVALYVLLSTNTRSLLYSQLGGPILKELSVTFCTHQKCGRGILYVLISYKCTLNGR